MQTTISTVYPKYYPAEVVDFFLQLHGREHTQEGVESGNRGVLLVEGKVVGVGCADGNHITSVYVLPEHQGRGYGSHILDCLEEHIAREHDIAVLDASLPAVMLYEHRGYKTTGHGVLDVGNDVKLVYEIMEKQLRA
ncbi:MAG: GNAT family N-acetyltransferase [Coriobacteriales bacterium]